MAVARFEPLRFLSEQSLVTLKKIQYVSVNRNIHIEQPHRQNKLDREQE